MTVLAVILFATLLISAMCSLFEAVLYSTRMGVLEAAASGDRHAGTAERMLEMKRNIAVPTSAILILNTIANTAGAMLAGIVAARVLGAGGAVAVSVGLTLGILFLSEILPKTYGAVRWRIIWPHVVTPLVWMQRLLYPMIRVTLRFSETFTGSAVAPSVTEDEIRATIRMGRREGELTRDELQLITAVFRFDDMIARQILVPRREVVILKKAWSIEQCTRVIQQSGHTRYPVCVDSLDDAVGLLHIKDLQRHLGKPTDLESLARPLPAIPATMRIGHLLRQMQRTRTHMVIAVDERGTALGVVTMENVLEQIIGDVQDEFDNEPYPKITTEGPNQFLVQGPIRIAHLNEELKIDLHAPDVDTLSGLLVDKLGRLVEPGDTVALEGIVAEVLDVRAGQAWSVRLRVTMAVDRPPLASPGMRGDDGEP